MVHLLVADGGECLHILSVDVQMLHKQSQTMANWDYGLLDYDTIRLCSFLVHLHPQLTWCHNQEGLSHNVHCCENLSFLVCCVLIRKSREIENSLIWPQAMKIGAQAKSSGRICSDGTEFLGFVQRGSQYTTIDLLVIIHCPIFTSNIVFKIGPCLYPQVENLNCWTQLMGLIPIPRRILVTKLMTAYREPFVMRLGLLLLLLLLYNTINIIYQF
jgi:hypothetical protein